jgi:trehalose 6-phosphate synthase/phosphatase
MNSFPANTTPGSFIERKRCTLTWHYRLTDPQLSVSLSRQCQKELEGGVARRWDVDVIPGKANVEVRPTFINKGEIAKRLVAEYHDAGSLEFAVCMGDDNTDEDMFRSLNAASGPVLDADHVFTVTVGASTTVTLARWHLLEPEDVIDCAALLAGLDKPRGMGEVNLAALSTVEGKIPGGAL